MASEWRPLQRHPLIACSKVGRHPDTILAQRTGDDAVHADFTPPQADASRRLPIVIATDIPLQHITFEEAIMNSRIGRTMVALAALVGASMPVASQADDNPALDRCVRMFVKEVVPANHSVEIKRDDIVASTKAITATRSKVTLIARGEKHSKLFGRASCVIHRDGSLIAMYLYDSKPGPISFGRPKVLARNVDARTAYADDMKPF
jgi:hypothetical protein